MLAPSENRERLLGRISLGVCLLATLLGVCLHVAYLTHAGALWRDEANSIQLVTSSDPSLGWWPPRDSFPLLHYALLRVWSALGLAASDFALRIPGLLVGLSLLGSLWLSARLMECRLPFISLGLLAANLTLVRWGDGVRAYGCGSLFILLTLALVWKLVEQPGRRTFLAASVAAVLSVQTLYHNACLVLAACLAGCVVCARHRQWKTAMLVLGAGALAALSLLPYVSVLMGSPDSSAPFQMGFELDRAWATLAFALGSGLDWPILGWLGLAPFILGAGWMALLSRAKGPGISPGDLPLFASSALAAGIPLYFVFLSLSGFPIQPWYYLPLMVFAAAAMDAALAHWCRQLRAWPALFIALMVCVPYPAIWKAVQCRQTNIDLIAAELRQQAKPGDLILVSPFFFGITFDRYYKGPATWTTLPPISDQKTHRIDLFTKALSSKPLLRGMLEQVERTLAAGNSVWMVGDWPPPQPGETPPELPDPPPPGQRLGWAEGRLCTYAWERQTVLLVATHALQAARVQVQPGIPISEVENVRLIKATGWRTERTAPPTP